MSWSTKRQPFGSNRAPLLTGTASDGSGVDVPVAVDPATGAVLTEASGGGGGGGTSSTFGATFPTTGTAVGASDGTNMQPLEVDGAGNLKVNLETSVPAGSNTIGSVIVTDGTNPVNVLKSDGTAAGLDGILVAGTGRTTTTVTLNSGTPNSTWFDIVNYSWISVEILTNTTPATLTWQTTGDAAQTNTSGMYLQTANSVPALTTTSATGTFSGPRTGRYFRVASNNGAGSTTLAISFFTMPSAFPVIMAGQNGTWNVGANSATGIAVPANAFFMGASDGTNLQPLRVNIGGDGTSATLSLGTQQSIYNGASLDRVRGANAAANTTGTGLLGTGELVWDGTNWQRATSLATNSGVQAVGVNDGTNTANVVAGDTGFNGVSVASGTKTITFTTSASGAQTLLANTSIEGYSWMEVVYTSVGVGLALAGQFSTATGGTYVNSSTFQTINTAGTALAALGVTSNTIYGSTIHGNFFQIAVSALTSGTFAGTVTLRAVPPPSYTMAVSLNTGTNNIGAVQQAKSNSAVAVSASATVVKNSAGYLSGVLVSAAGTAQAMTIFDNASAASGTVIGFVPSTATAGSFWPFNMPAANGITCSGSSNNPAVTVAFS